MPLEPIAAILEAFRTHDVVALGEGRHNNEPGYAFRLALIRDPRFAATVNDIVVESGSSTHQDAMDRFIRGEAVSDKELRLAWQDTTAPDDVWDVPMYEEFFRAVRIVNASLPPERKLRVLLGDPPFDWEHATREEAIRIGLRRDPFAAELIQREVLSKQRRALVIYGDGHFVRGPIGGGSSLVTRLVAMGARVLNIWTHATANDLQMLQPDINTWRIPALAFTAGTILGAAPYSFFRAVGSGDETGMQDQFDAVLYLGPASSITIRRSEIAPSLCADADYMKMLLSRMALMEPPGATAPPGMVSPSERLKRYCDGVSITNCRLTIDGLNNRPSNPSIVRRQSSIHSAHGRRQSPIVTHSHATVRHPKPETRVTSDSAKPITSCGEKVIVSLRVIKTNELIKPVATPATDANTVASDRGRISVRRCSFGQIA